MQLSHAVRVPILPPLLSARSANRMTLNHRLQTLEGSGLIRLVDSYPELEYLFRHALLQEVTYHTLVKQDRRRLHLVVGETLERTYPERSADLAAVLARHFAEAGDA